MTVIELIIKSGKKVVDGYGNVEIFVEDAQEEYHIHSIQQNTCPDVENESKIDKE